ncbi:MAG: hypothetical protein K2Y32_07210 [Candidatus Obscuribacterales bacterium]|nr:hypothetical protein [Candidatus Obscuribacterales bacterium]
MKSQVSSLITSFCTNDTPLVEPFCASSLIAGPAFYIVLLLLSMLLTLIVVLVSGRRKQVKQRLALSLDERMAKLYQLATELGDRSDYLASPIAEDRKAAAQKEAIFEFYRKLTILDAAYQYTKKLNSQKRPDGELAIESLSKCLRFCDLLILEAESFEESILTILPVLPETAKKESSTEKQLPLSQKEESQAKFKTCRFYKPSWSEVEEYASRLVIDSEGAMAQLLQELNQLEEVRRLTKS